MRSGRPRARWTTLDWAASLTISTFWHLLVLMVLVMAVHPFKLPDTDRAIDLQLLPRLTMPPLPTVDLQLRPRQDVAPPKPPTPPEPTLERARPQASLLPKVDEVKPLLKTPPPRLLDMARPTTPELEPPVEVERRTPRPQRLQTQPAAPNIPAAPPEPVTVTRPGPALRQPVEIPQVQAPGRRSLDASRALPALPQVAAPQARGAPAPAPAAEAEAPIATAPSQVQVLTNESVVQAPVEIRPRDRPAGSPPLNTQTGASDIPALPAGAQAAGGGAAAGGGQTGQAGQAGGAGGGAQGGLRPFPNSGLGGGLRGGLRTTLGCENPDTYKLTPEEREVCLQRFGQRARSGPDLGLPIPAAKQAGFDRYVNCHKATTGPGIPSSSAASTGTSIPGLGADPGLAACPPGTR